MSTKIKGSETLYRTVDDEHWKNKTYRQYAEAHIGDTHLLVTPDDNYDQPWTGGYNVWFFKDKDGQPDTSNLLEMSWVKGQAEDLEEIADTYAARLANGVKPKDMFRDIEEANSRALKKLYEQLQAEGKLP